MRGSTNSVPWRRYRNADFSSIQNISDFVAKAEKGFVETLPRSEKIPDYTLSTNTGMKEVVGSNLEEQLKSHDVDAILYVYSSSCVPCEKWTKLMENVATTIAQKHPKVPVKFFKINGVHNDIKDFKIKGFPTFLIYPKDDRPNFVESNIPDIESEKMAIEWFKEVLPVWQNVGLADL